MFLALLSFVESTSNSLKVSPLGSPMSTLKLTSPNLIVSLISLPWVPSLKMAAPSIQFPKPQTWDRLSFALPSPHPWCLIDHKVLAILTSNRLFFAFSTFKHHSLGIEGPSSFLPNILLAPFGLIAAPESLLTSLLPLWFGKTSASLAHLKVCAVAFELNLSPGSSHPW